MGRSVTPKYRIEMTGCTPMAWHVKLYGKPTLANLVKWVEAHQTSLLPTGVNAHIPKALGYTPSPTYAVIIRQADNEVMAEWKAGVNNCTITSVTQQYGRDGR